MQKQPVTFIANAHGWTGPVSVSYPNYYWPQSGKYSTLSAVLKLTCSDNWFRALNELGVPTVYDPDEGIGAGGYFLASDIQPNNQTRSDARRTYYDPFFGRKNYDILQKSHVTRVLFEGPNQNSPQHGNLFNGSQSSFGNLSTTQKSARVRKVRQAGQRQQSTNVPLHATGVEVSLSLIGGKSIDHY